ncbi:KRAB [Mytilus edulis]|uniref:KRAB n=1 Tax=Mytilus edulis TaxID=6550 RepID=A0A8S3Q8W8_MYTED|nr:KRAB [Mytilus edulis]
METKEEIMHIRLGQYILSCPFCKRGFSRRADLYNHKLCMTLTNCKDMNNNDDKPRVNVTTRKLEMFSCPICGELFNRWSVFCRHTSFHTYFSAIQESHGHRAITRPAFVIGNKNEDVNCVSKENVTEDSENSQILNIKSESGLKQNQQKDMDVPNRFEYKKETNKKKYCVPAADKKRGTSTKKARVRCKICYRSVSGRNNLAAHMRIHSNQRPYKCKYCNYRFKQLSHVKNHERLHSGETPWQCSLCGKKFHQKSNLDYHMNNNH